MTQKPDITNSVISKTGGEVDTQKADNVKDSSNSEHDKKKGFCVHCGAYNKTTGIMADDECWSCHKNHAKADKPIENRLTDEFKEKFVAIVVEIASDAMVQGNDCDIDIHSKKLLSLIASEIEKAEKQAWTEGYTSGKEADA